MTEVSASQYRPTSVSPPGETLAEALEERGITQSELAARMNRPTKTINEIVRGKSAITHETAIELERAVGISAEFWVSREGAYRSWLARQSDRRKLAERSGWLRELPLKDMLRFGWVKKAANDSDLVASCLAFFGVSSVEAWEHQYRRPLAAFRMAKAETQLGAVAAWLRAGERAAAEVASDPYDSHLWRSTLVDLRALTVEPDPAKFLPALRMRCASAGVAVVLVPVPKGCPASGATRWLSPGKAVLQLSVRYRTNDHLWFTFFHEAAHLLLHGRRLEFLEGVGLATVEESEADRFAGNLLIPPAAVPKMRALAKARVAVERFAAELGIAPGIVVGRMQRDGILSWSHLNGLKVRYRWNVDY